ncbi:peptidase C65 Otubain-domain-containing protein [Catenaria anguillulae PL171]|uniref:ubiquitinyl hydrolase 1 n=1 Tax=Catenaria anguillulae PL171 TaxID=765915 RepID=A0A1Y2HBR9_9FUNG|nr:peptidase C65 Otubain-domain-containing protein [Catenaria anguillulae PL171]
MDTPQQPSTPAANAAAGATASPAAQLTDEQILAGEQAIKDAVARESQLVSVPLPLTDLRQEFQSNAPFLAKINDLATNFSHFRRCRGDGNCFYRAFVFAWYERVLGNPARYLARAHADMAKCKEVLLANGFQLLVIEDFHDVAVDTLKAIETGAIHDMDMLLSRFQSDEVSNAIVVLFRFVCSAYLQQHQDEYLPFVLDDADTMQGYCAHHVEAMGRDADHVSIIALSKMFAVNVVVAYLDSGAHDDATIHRFDGNEADPADVVHFLYRPGHYDLIYPRQ